MLGEREIAAEVGFGSTTTFRDHFKDVMGATPNANRAAFRHVP
ncbi:hypothetical protein [Saccharothrix variisporea]|nr:hypothetical protein [Saccharothrix variisporea]